MKYKNTLIITVFAIAAIFVVWTQVRMIQLRQEEVAVKQAHNDHLETIQNEYDFCVQFAFEEYAKDWDLQCTIFSDKETDCTLPRDVADMVNESHEKDRAECLEVYKAMK